MLIRQTEERPGDAHGRAAVAIQREEPHARFAGGVADIHADVQFVEVGEPGQGGQAFGADAEHAEADDAEVGLAFEEVGREAGRQDPGDGGGVATPMQEEELIPALPQQRAAVRAAARGEQALGGFVHRVTIP